MINRIHDGKSYTEISSLTAEEQLMLMGEKDLDRTKIVSLHTCCYKFSEHIEAHYYIRLKNTWQITS